MRTLLISALVLLTFWQVTAQNSLLNFKEENILINGASVDVANTMLKGDLNNIKKSWKSFIKKHIDEKMSDDNGVLTVKETVINQITDKRGDLLTYIYNKDNEISLNVAYKLGYDVYMNSAQYETEFKKLEDFVNLFVYNYYNDYLPKYIKGKNKSLKVLTKEKSKAEKSLKKSEKETAKLNKSNASIKKETTATAAKIITTEDDAKKKSLDTTKSELETQATENEKTINYNSGLMSTQQSVVATLSPKIDELKLDIDSAKLTLIEVRSKVKSFK